MKLWKYIFIVVFLLFSLISISVLQLPDGKFHLIACNVGQGDATLLIYKNIQILVDGGPDDRVLNCLGKYLPFWDRRLELVILTHPDKDHFQGLIEVFRQYKIDNYLYNQVTVSKPEYRVLENEVGSHTFHPLYPHTGQVVRLDMIHLDILAPFEQELSGINGSRTGEEMSEDETNTLSVVNLISFGNFKAILTGDMPPEVSDKIATTWTSDSVNYIKISHHGSKNGTTENFLKAFMPKLAVISVGKNLYGHPSTEILGLLEKNGIKYLRTDKEGDIEAITDGEKYWIR